MDYTIRQFQSADLDAIKAITIEGFTDVSLDHALEEKLGGELAGHDWQWRKARHIDDDVAAHASGIFVAEAEGKVLGYISTGIDREAGKGRIPNLAVAATARGQGIGCGHVALASVRLIGKRGPTAPRRSQIDDK